MQSTTASCASSTFHPRRHRTTWSCDQVLHLQGSPIDRSASAARTPPHLGKHRIVAVSLVPDRPAAEEVPHRAVVLARLKAQPLDVLEHVVSEQDGVLRRRGAAGQ